MKLVVVSSSDAAIQEPGVDYCKVDIQNADDLGAILRAANPDQIYHLAGVSSVPDCWNNPRLASMSTWPAPTMSLKPQCAYRLRPECLNVSTSQVYARSDDVLTETSLVGS